MVGAVAARRRGLRPGLVKMACCFQLVEVDHEELMGLRTAYRLGTRFFRMQSASPEDAEWGCVQVELRPGMNDDGMRVHLNYLACKAALDSLGGITPTTPWIAAHGIYFLADTVAMGGPQVPDLSDGRASVGRFFRTLMSVNASQLGLSLDQLDPGCFLKVAEDFVELYRGEESVERWLEALRQEFEQPRRRLIRLDRNFAHDQILTWLPNQDPTNRPDLAGQDVTQEATAAGAEDTAGQETAAAGADVARQEAAVLAQTPILREVGRGSLNFLDYDQLLKDVARAKLEWQRRMRSPNSWLYRAD
ncbi:hypothetical protein GNI_152900 [Gregarina niphandrodes]|uniref:Uncharacterized protein n=1 Tax=Gregarina niphandrodes TaxID=110365 RepID=A0A023AZF3_GRENI|nr:hypothetical protein GNI_152900 [Gregarina niphandrodes]EZG44070.1 hypothetical protein GNI_152900 [Gregarina niphandrodes]|eukprot:XP_011132827.1 hypothetical protein GNI_152900 [Gregarina niphandrodes]